MYEILKKFCPTICDLIGKEDKIWGRISKKYRSRLDFIKAESKINGSAYFSRGFLDNWLLYKLGDEEPKHFLNFIDKIISNIWIQIPDELRKKFKHIVKEAIGNFDSQEDRTTNSVGEIFVIHHYLNQGYSLGAIEVKLPNMNPVDFLFQSNKTGEYLLLEVMNLHPKESKIESIEDLKNLFVYRYVKKFKEKSQNYITTAKKFNLKLFPIIWIEPNELSKYYEFFKDTSSDFSEEVHILRGVIFNKTDYQYFLSPVNHINLTWPNYNSDS